MNSIGNTAKKRTVRFLRYGLIVIFLGVIGYSLYQILDTNNNYVKEEQIRKQMAQFKPVPVNLSIANTDAPLKDGELAPVIFNQSVVDAQAFNSDIVGWLTLDGTRIDYPFAKSTDNDFYLRRDINKIDSYAGTLFVDYKCDSDFSDFSSIIYGHNMKNGTMFSDIKRYDNAEFFDKQKTGWLFLADAAYSLEIFAYMLVRSDDNIVYGAKYADDSEKQNFLTYIEQNALRYRDISLTVSDKLVVLSTCAYNFDEARSVIIAKLVKIQ